MSDPVVEQIAQEIESRLENVTKANGFNQDLIVIRPARLGLITIKDRLAILSQGGPKPNDNLSANGIIPGSDPSQEFLQDFTVTLVSRQSDKDNTPAETLVNRMWADAKKAILRAGESDAAEWHTFGGLAREAAVLESEIGIWQDDNATAVIELMIAVKYRTAENDPYTLR